MKPEFPMPSQAAVCGLIIRRGELLCDFPVVGFAPRFCCMSATAPAKRADGNTDLHIAAVLGDVDAVRALLADGARADDTNTHGRFPEDVTSNYEIAAMLKGVTASVIDVNCICRCDCHVYCRKVGVFALKTRVLSTCGTNLPACV